jgi:hypothetical protein
MKPPTAFGLQNRRPIASQPTWMNSKPDPNPQFLAYIKNQLADAQHSLSAAEREIGRLIPGS